jgi:hypothetical protein
MSEAPLLIRPYIERMTASEVRFNDLYIIYDIYVHNPHPQLSCTPS